ncbi:MAG: peptidoglycan bridge formation glycyltransferase FemA/FemB family protein [Catenulispora sp.]|nr:peptidoglycan bridge formation glycyltransferase FemA/FemB family protein [Catenulispora sp.]
MTRNINESERRLRLQLLPAAEYLSFVRTLSSASFLQCPSWASVKREWAAEQLGWIDRDGAIVGVAQVLYRRVPRAWL